MTGLLVLITGTGRSGTSTMSGSLHHLGLYVPGPHLRANESNPKGFFESSWAVRFHKQITKSAHIIDFDSQPDAFDRARRAITPALRAELVSFLTDQARENDQLVVKDPRSVWAQALWREAAADAGLETRYVSMLRHPAEVIGSRTTYYGPDPDDASRRRHYATVNTARWVNHSIVSERETRGFPRIFVRYTDLLENWRQVMAEVRNDLGLTYNSDLTPGERHDVDDFIDPDLRRHEHTWAELEVPAALQQVAQSVWECLVVLADSKGEDPATSTRLDALGEAYAHNYGEAAAICQDATDEARADAREEGTREAERRMAERQARIDASTPLEARSAAEIPGRDLLRIAGRRAARKLRRR